jgi:hypothetical protein
MKCCTLPIVLLFLNSSLAFSGENCFPSERRIIFSPSHEFQFSWKKNNLAGDASNPHYLFIQRKGEKDSQKIFEFYNQACMHWSPDEKYFTISHLVGSNISEDYIFESNHILHKTDVRDLLPNQIRNYYGKGILHGYMETLSWNQKGLFIRAWGDRENEPMTFDVILKCSMEQNRWACKKTANSPQRPAKKL